MRLSLKSMRSFALDQGLANLFCGLGPDKPQTNLLRAGPGAAAPFEKCYGHACGSEVGSEGKPPVESRGKAFTALSFAIKAVS